MFCRINKFKANYNTYIMKNTITLTITILFCCNNVFSQRLLTSWSQQNIENYTLEMYNAAQKLTATELLGKNLKDQSWGEVFLTLNVSVNNYSTDTAYLKGLANEVTNKKETKLTGTSRLIIWERITNGDIVFEGKGLVMDNDLFIVAGRANQILQSLTKKNFGFVSIKTTAKELEVLKNKWLDFLAGKPVTEFKPIELKNAKIAEISTPEALEALIISLQENPVKNEIIKKCLKNVYKLDEMPKEKGSPASYCNPDTYTFGYLGMLFGNEKLDETKDAKWWKKFWDENHLNLVWNTEKGIYEIRK